MDIQSWKHILVDIQHTDRHSIQVHIYKIQRRFVVRITH